MYVWEAGIPKGFTLKIIGIHGPIGSGKTTSARMIRTLLPGTSRILPFSAPLKRIAIEMGWNGKKDAKGRKLLQILGTDVGRNLISPKIWVTKWNDQIYEKNVDYLIADDIRFKNELARIHELSGLTIKIKGRMGLSPTIPSHKSEKEIEDKYFHYCIDNSGTLEELNLDCTEIISAAIKSNFKFLAS